MGTEEAILYSYDLATLPSIIPAFASKKDLIICDEVGKWWFVFENGASLALLWWCLYVAAGDGLRSTACRPLLLAALLADPALTHAKQVPSLPASRPAPAPLAGCELLHPERGPPVPRQGPVLQAQRPR
jgi:hypothetical protein